MTYDHVTIYWLPSNGAITQCGRKAHAIKAGRTSRVQHFQSFRLEGELGHLGLLGLETFGPWEDSTEDYLFWSDVDVPYKGVDPSLGSLLRLGYQPLFFLNVPTLANHCSQSRPNSILSSKVLGPEATT